LGDRSIWSGLSRRKTFSVFPESPILAFNRVANHPRSNESDGNWRHSSGLGLGDRLGMAGLSEKYRGYVVEKRRPTIKALCILGRMMHDFNNI
jgi:hypothetical protein